MVTREAMERVTDLIKSAEINNNQVDNNTSMLVLCLAQELKVLQHEVARLCQTKTL
jgi:hypothetical protein